jgi:hypothetical protein
MKYVEETYPVRKLYRSKGEVKISSTPNREYGSYGSERLLDKAKENDVVFTRDDREEAATNKSFPIIPNFPFPLKLRETDILLTSAIALTSM